MPDSNAFARVGTEYNRACDWMWFAGAKNNYLAYWSPLVATVALVTTGAELTGPSMNPAFVSPSSSRQPNSVFRSVVHRLQHVPPILQDFVSCWELLWRCVH